MATVQINSVNGQNYGMIGLGITIDQFQCILNWNDAYPMRKLNVSQELDPHKKDYIWILIVMIPVDPRHTVQMVFGQALRALENAKKTKDFQEASTYQKPEVKK